MAILTHKKATAGTFASDKPKRLDCESGTPTYKHDTDGFYIKNTLSIRTWKVYNNNNTVYELAIEKGVGVNKSRIRRQDTIKLQWARKVYAAAAEM